MNTNFTDGTTVVVAAWLNDVNDTVYDILGDGTNPPTDKAALLANLGGATLTDVTDAIDAYQHFSGRSSRIRSPRFPLK